ncbi:hypothetical protein EK904_008713 [Melospiza melodia maxima]|nr:hypothetical protein EK904_008713 [Melospiza melodia maxima]
MDMLQILRKTTERLECDYCSFRGTDYENIQIHMGTVHPECCDEMDAAGLGKLIFYQKSAKLFHCHKCFFTSKMYCNVYYHIKAQHAAPEKWNEEQKEQQVEGDSDSSKKSVMLEPQKPTLSPESGKPALSPELPKSEPVVSPRLQKSSVSPEPQKSAQVTSPEPEKSVQTKSALVSSEPWKPISSVYPEGWKPVLSPDTWKHSPPVSPELRKSSHTVSSDSWKPSFFPEVRKPGVSVSPESWKLSESRKSMYFSETQKSTSAASSEIQKRAHFPEPRKRVLFPETRKSNPAASTDVQKRAVFSEPQNQTSTSAVSTEGQKQALCSEAQKSALVSSEVQKHALFSEAQKLTSISSEVQESTSFLESQKSTSPEVQKHGLFTESQKPTPVSPETLKQAVFTDCQKSAVSPDVQKHAVFSEMQKPAAALSSDVQRHAETTVPSEIQKNILFSEPHKSASGFFSEPQTPSESGESDFLSHSLDDQKPLDDLFSQDEQSILAKESPEHMLYSCPKKKPKKENQENSDSELNSSECGKPVVDSMEIKEQESNSDQEQYDMESSDYSKESKMDATTPTQPPCVLQFTEEKEAFISEEEIAKYMKRGKGKYYCKICCCRAMKKGAVLHHLVNKHNVQSPYKCKICGKAFLLESLLKNHVAAHGQSLLKCPRCNFESNFPRGFKKHLTHCQSRHSDDTPKKHLDSLEPLEEQI